MSSLWQQANGQRRQNGSRRAWLERLVLACDRALSETPDPSDPDVRPLLRDVTDLRARLAAELASEQAPAEVLPLA